MHHFLVELLIKLQPSRRGETLDIQTIIAELAAKRDRLNQAIAAL